MWWIAACLGALLWLLVARIKLKDKERQARRADPVVSSDAQGRMSFIADGFTPVAASYLRQEPDAAALLLLFAHVTWDARPSEVHMEVVPVRVTRGTWPTLAAECLWVKGAEGKLMFEPPQTHWERLSDLEPWLDKLACFAEGLPLVPGDGATLADYRVYAWARRTAQGDAAPEGTQVPADGAQDVGVDVEVVGEPNV